MRRSSITFASAGSMSPRRRGFNAIPQTERQRMIFWILIATIGVVGLMLWAMGRIFAIVMPAAPPPVRTADRQAALAAELKVARTSPVSRPTNESR
jgi:hypothetical protein